MRTRNKLGALLCALAMVLSLAACGGGSMSSADVVEKLKAADEKLNGATSMQFVAKLDMAMTQDYGVEGMEPEDINISADMDFSFITEPMKMSGAVVLNAPELGGSINMDMYAVEEDGMFTLYLGMFGSWMAYALDMSEFEAMEAMQDSDIDLYAGNEDSAKKIGEETIGEVKTTKYSITFSGASLETLMVELGVVDMMQETMGEMTGMDWGELYKDIGDMTMYVYLDADDTPVRYEVDCLDMANKMIDKAMQMSADMYGVEMTGSASFSKLLITMDVSNVDAVEDFEIPAEVIDNAMYY